MQVHTLTQRTVDAFLVVLRRLSVLHWGAHAQTLMNIGFQEAVIGIQMEVGSQQTPQRLQLQIIWLREMLSLDVDSTTLFRPAMNYTTDVCRMPTQFQAFSVSC